MKNLAVRLYVFLVLFLGNESYPCLAGPLHPGIKTPDTAAAFSSVVRSFKAYKKGNEYILEIAPALQWEKVSYYIVDRNRSVLGGGSLAAVENTIVLSRYPEGEYKICLRTRDAVVSKTFVISRARHD